MPATTRLGPRGEVLHVEVVAPRQAAAEPEPRHGRRRSRVALEDPREPVAVRTLYLVDATHELGLVIEMLQLAQRIERERGVGREDLADLHAAQSLAFVIEVDR